MFTLLQFLPVREMREKENNLTNNPSFGIFQTRKKGGCEIEMKKKPPVVSRFSHFFHHQK